jgi:hypothetical protein
MQALLDNEVPLCALWVFDFSTFDGTWNVTQSNSRAYQLEAIAAANRKLGVSTIQ